MYKGKYFLYINKSLLETYKIYLQFFYNSQVNTTESLTFFLIFIVNKK